MRRPTLIILAGFLAAGCASSKPAPTALQDRQYLPAPALALAMDPQTGAGTGLVLSRDGRDITAYGGFQDLSSESYDIQTDDDQQFYNYPSTYERRVISDRVGVVFR